MSNTAIWDMRTYKLLYIKPSLNHSIVTFSDTGYGMYAHSVERQRHLYLFTSTSFRTINPHDYTNIGKYIESNINLYS